MITFDESQNIIKEIAGSKTLATETIALTELKNRVLAEDVISLENVPSFNNSAMDGFAVRAAETPGRFKVVSSHSAGDLKFASEHSTGSAVEIMTGAVMPADSKYDCVVRVEDCVKMPDGFIEVVKKHESSANVRYAGTDIRKGDRLLSAQTILDTSHIMALASIGKATLKVFRRPRIAVIATGSELVDIAVSDLPHGKIRNSSQPYLTTVLESMGCEVKSFGILRDDVGKFKDFLNDVENSFDVVVSTGAVSMGNHDFVHDVLTEQGALICFHKVAIRPGKPILFAQLKSGAVYFGLPGNPVSSAIGLNFFLATYLRALAGLVSEHPSYAINAAEKSKPAGLTCFFRAKVTVDSDAKLKINIHANQASNAVQPQIETNAWAILPQNANHVVSGEKVRFILNGAVL